MQLSPKEIPQGHSEQQISVANSPARPEWPRIDGALECSCSIDRTPAQIMAVLRFKGAIVIECARCCEEFSCPVDGDVAVVLVEKDSQASYAAGDDLEDAKDDGVYVFDNSTDWIDISDSLYDELMTALPMKPLCDENCSGGEIKKNAPADQKPHDSRWDALEKLKGKLNR